ncbi:hypothetical protein R5R35_011257 [Gryllus longicercus]|uniref:Odorant binding protein n=1 Tax=Gryllus longicercus TaxID=2509291 RepID=A0AAN9WEM7_9ORTH
MAARHAIAALLAVVVVVAAVVSADGDLPSRWKLRRWVRECRKDAAIAKSKPLYAFKKSIAGLYDPKTRHAFRKTKVSFAKFEIAKIRNPSEAEKCLLECLAEKQGLINGSQLQPTKIMNVMTAFGKRINEMHAHARVNMTKLKRNTAKCIVGTHGSAKTCELGFHLYHCLRSAIMESIYYEEMTTAQPFTSTAAYMPMPTSTAPSVQEARPDPAPPAPLPNRFMAPPPPPPPMPVMAAAAPPPSGLAPSYVAYRQGSGMVQVFGENPTAWRPHWRGPPGMHHGPRMMGPMI